MRLRGIMGAALATALLAGCATYTAEPYALETATPGAEVAFMLDEYGNWGVHRIPPRAPYNQERPPSGMTAAWGMGTAAPVACGLGAVKTGYFSGARGRLVCAIDDGSSRLRVQPIGKNVYVDVHDVVRGPDGLSVLGDLYGGGLQLLNLTPDGGILGAARLPVQVTPDQAVLLPSGRVAALQRQASTRACVWTVYAFEGATARAVSETPADGCFDGQMMRDQVTGAIYFQKDYLEPSLVRLNENAEGLVVEPIDISALPLRSNGRISAPVIFDGVMYFFAGFNEDRGIVIGLYDLKTLAHRRIVYPGPGPAPEEEKQAYPTAPTEAQVPNVTPFLNRARPIPRIFGFMPPLAPGQPPRVVIMPPSGPNQVAPLDLSAAVPVA